MFSLDTAKIGETVSELSESMDDLGSIVESMGSVAWNIITGDFSELKQDWDNLRKDTRELRNDISASIKSLNNIIDMAIDYANEEMKKVNYRFSGTIDSVKKNIGGFVSDTSVAISNTKNVIIKSASNTGAYISDKWDWAVEEAFPKVKDYYFSVWCDIANTTISLVEGVLKFGESLVDFSRTWTAIPVSAITGLIDLVQFTNAKITGNDDWTSVTKSMWSYLNEQTATDYVGEAHDWFYNTSAGKTLDKLAHKPFKSNGIVYEIGSGIGYTAGIILLAVVTGGASLATSIIAGVAGAGSEFEDVWTKSVTVGYGDSKLSIDISYDECEEIKNLKIGETKTVTYEDSEGNKIKFTFKGLGNGQYEVIDQNGNSASFEKITENGVIKGFCLGNAKGLWDFGQWYLGNKISGIKFDGLASKVTSPILKKIVPASLRISLDTATAAVESPFQSFMDSWSDDKTFLEAWNDNGGWKKFFSQAALGAIGSTTGEVFDFDKIFKKNDHSKVDSKVNAKLDGNDITAKLDGSDITEKLDGSDITAKLDGSDITEKLDGSDITEKLDENEIVTKFDGSEITAKFDVYGMYLDDPELFELRQKFNDIVAMSRSGVEINQSNEMNYLRNYFGDYSSSDKEILEKCANKVARYIDQKLNLEYRGGFEIGGVTVNAYGRNTDLLRENLIKAKRALEALPDEIKKYVNNINVYDVQNPFDDYWMIKYNDLERDFVSAATGGGHGTINLWEAGGNNPVDEIYETFLHESGHCLDYFIGNGDAFTDVAGSWRDAQIYDSAINGGIESVTDYGGVSIHEDFAESVKLMFTNMKEFKEKFPNRYNILFDLIYN